MIQDDNEIINPQQNEQQNSEAEDIKLQDVNDTSKSGKLFWSIGEVASMFNVNASLIRYWEKEFSIIKPKKNAKGNRLFTAKDIENFHVIYNLVKERGMTLQGAKLKLKAGLDDEKGDFEIIKCLKNLRSMIVELKDYIQ